MLERFEEIGRRRDFFQSLFVHVRQLPARSPLSSGVSGFVSSKSERCGSKAVSEDTQSNHCTG